MSGISPEKLSELKKEVAYRWRVQSFSKSKPLAQCVAYLDSRIVQDLLDEVVGPENWQDKYEEHKNNLFCGIGININGEWVWKWDCGTESNVDKQKGEASDAFKRAAVKWGIGRFLYSKPLIWIPSSEQKRKDNYPFVVDQNGKQVWDLTDHINRNGLDKGYNTTVQPQNKNSSETGGNSQQTISRSLTVSEVDKKWNGKIYNGIVYIDKVKIKVSGDQLQKLQKHPKYKAVA